MNNSLSSHQQQILLNLFKDGTEKKLLMQKLINGCSSKDEIEKMCDIISDEFLLNGITEDFEANAYGKELENILDIINRDRL